MDGKHSTAFSINDAGQVGGWTYDTGAFITGPNGEGMVDLNTLLDIPPGVILIDATGINNNGQVIAIAEISVPIPEPETYALMLVGLGLVGLGRGVKGCRIWLSIIDSALLQKIRSYVHIVFFRTDPQMSDFKCDILVGDDSGLFQVVLQLRDQLS